MSAQESIEIWIQNCDRIEAMYKETEGENTKKFGKDDKISNQKCPFFAVGCNQKDSCRWHHKLFCIGKERPAFCKVKMIEINLLPEEG